MRILLVEDNADDCYVIRGALRAADLGDPDILWADRLTPALARLAEHPTDLVLLDLSLPDARGVDAFTRLHRAAPDVPVLVLAEVHDETLALEAARHGAQDYLLKHYVKMDPGLLGRAIRGALERHRREEELERRRRETDAIADLAQSINMSLDRDTILRRVAELARELSAADRTVIALREEPNGTLAFHYRAGAGDEMPAGAAVDHVLRTGLPFRGESDTRAELVVPILTSGGIQGLLHAENDGGRSFSDHDELILLRLANQAAIAIHNSHLFAQERAARAAAEASEARLRLLFESAPLAMWVFDAETLGFLAVNDAAVRQYGYTAEEFARMRLVDVQADEDVRRLLALHDHAVTEGRTGVRDSGEWRQSLKDGRLVDVEIATHALEFAGRPAVLAVLHDITHRKCAEEALRESAERLRRAEKMEAAGRLAGSVAHDFNNLLTVIAGRAKLIADRAETDARPRKHAETIQAAAARAGALTRELLAFGQKQFLQPEVFDLNAVIDGMLPLLRRVIADDVRLRFMAAPGLGPVRADRTQIEQVVLNLVVNARDAMPDGGHLMLETMEAVLDERFAARHPDVRPARYALLAVSDTGRGMSADVQARIFEPFFTTKEPGQAVGLGLSTVYGVVKQSGGAILVYSEPGRGTTFKIYLPIVPAAESVASEPTSAGSAGTTSRERGGETILLVEDETQVRQLAAEILEEAGYIVLEARHPAEAALIGERHAGEIHLLLTDVVMPEASGPDLAERLRKSRRELKVLYMSGYTGAAVVQLGALGPEASFLPKPFTAEALARMVHAALER